MVKCHDVRSQQPSVIIGKGFKSILPIKTKMSMSSTLQLLKTLNSLLKSISFLIVTMQFNTFRHISCWPSD